LRKRNERRKKKRVGEKKETKKEGKTGRGERGLGTKKLLVRKCSWRNLGETASLDEKHKWLKRE